MTATKRKPPRFVDSFLAIGGSMHGRLLERRNPMLTTVYVFKHRQRFTSFEPETDLETLPIEVYHLRTYYAARGRRELHYFVVETLGPEAALRMINELENEL